MEMKVDYNVIGQRIKARRKFLNWTQDHLAESLAVSVGYISQVERGVTKISLETLSEIARCLNCDMTELLSGVSPSREDYLDYETKQLYDQMSIEQRKLLLGMARLILNYPAK